MVFSVRVADDIMTCNNTSRLPPGQWSLWHLGPDPDPDPDPDRWNVSCKWRYTQLNTEIHTHLQYQIAGDCSNPVKNRKTNIASTPSLYFTRNAFALFRMSSFVVHTGKCPDGIYLPPFNGGAKMVCIPGSCSLVGCFRPDVEACRSSYFDCGEACR